VLVDDTEINVEAARELGLQAILHVVGASTILRLSEAFGIELAAA
jgi:hypothetical protein